MKTSNKLLIGFAAALLIIPMIVIAIDVKMNYVSRSERSKEEELHVERFNTASPGYTSIPVKEKFSTVNFADAADLFLSVHLIHDDNAGIKIPQEWKDVLTCRVTSTGELEISLTGDRKKVQSQYATLWIYAKDIKSLGITNAQHFYLSATADSLSLQLSRIKEAGMESSTAIRHLSVRADSVSNLSLPGGKQSSSARIWLRNSTLDLQNAPFTYLDIQAEGVSTIANSNNRDDDAIGLTADEMVLNTTGLSTINFVNLKVGKISGKLSDETVVNMPVVYLKKLL